MRLSLTQVILTKKERQQSTILEASSTNRLLFDEENHRYFFEDEPDLKTSSVTRILKKYYEEFDFEKMSAKIAKKRKVSQDEIKKE